MKKTRVFSEKICITASSQNSAHRTPRSFVVHRGVLWAGLAVLVIVLASCIYMAVQAAGTVRELHSQIDTLGQTLEAQSTELEQYQQQLGELEQAQPTS